MKKRRGECRRTAAMLLAALMVVNSAELPACTVYAAQSENAAQAENIAQSENVQEKNGQSESAGVMTITGFDELAEAVIKQQLPVGASEDAIVFPGTLDVTAAVSDTQEEADTTDNEEGASEGEEAVSGNAVSGAEEQGAKDGEDPRIKKLTLTDITWKINPEESDGEGFDSLGDCDGYCYVYVPVLPETDAAGNAVVLGEEAELPVIYVLIGEGDHVSVIAEEGYTEEGFCEGYKWENGSLVKNAGEGATTCSHGDICNGYQPAVKITDANASAYGFTTDADKAKYNGYYAITNAGQLYWFAAYVNGWSDSSDTRTSNAVLTADITVNSSLLSAKLNADGTPKTDADIRSWIPIGYNITDNGSAFQGTFDGQNHTISGICFSDTTADKGAGLFGVLDKGTISKVTLKDSYFKGKRYVGGICGQIGGNGGTIEYCTNEATVTGTDECVGGICGYNDTDSKETGTISGCANSGAISGVAFVGGICGKFQNGTMKECRNSGDVTGAATSGGIGGICGKFDDNSTVSDCENSGSISGATCVGGICGRSDGNASTITGCKNSGTVTGTATGEEGFIGGICGDNQGAITNCNNLADGAVSVSSGVSCVGGVCGSNVHKLEDCTNAATVTGWLVVGGICGYNAANDILQTTITSCTNSGTVKCAEAGETTEGLSYIGGICGWNDRGEQSGKEAYIYSCTNNGAIEASSAGKVGGICGYNKGSISKGSTGTANTNTANVTGGENTGGICGYSEGSVSGTNSGNVSGSKWVGGICGCYEGSSGMSGSTNSGNVTGSGDYVGGICGFADSGITISHSCSTGSVSGKKNVGGIAGSAGAVNHVYNTGSVTGTERDSAGVIIGGGTAAKDSCFYLDTILTDKVHAPEDSVTAMTASDFSSGRVAWLLNGKSSDSPTWYQWIDTDGKTKDSSPVLAINRDSADSGEEGESTNYGIVYQCLGCTAFYSNTNGKTAKHGKGVALPSTDENATTRHKCSLCEQTVAHSGVVYQADTANADTILASCSCGYEYGSIKIKAPDSLTYDGNAKKATIYTTGLVVPEGVTISPSDSDVTYKRIDNGTETSLTGQPTDAGTYRATLSLTGDDEESAEAGVIYTIAQAAPTVTWSKASETVYYTGNAISSDNMSGLLKVTGVGDTDITDDYDTADYTFSYRKSDSTGAFTDGLPTDLGEYQIKAKVTAKENYKEAEAAGYLTLTVDWFASARDADLHDQNRNDVSSGTEYWAQSITFTAPAGFTISKEVKGTYAASFTYQEETDKDGTTVTYYLKEDGSGRIAKKTATVYIDRTAPTFPESGDYGIQIEENRFKSLLNTITFGLVYRNNVDVKVCAKEDLSGIKEYYYYIDDSGSGTVKTVESLNALKDSGKFTAIDKGGVIKTLQNTADTKKYVVYAYAVDQAGNKSGYICSNGVVVDDTKPAITLTAPAKDAGTLTDSSATITLNASEAGTYFCVLTKDGEAAPFAMTDFADSTTENGRTAWTAKGGVTSASMAEGDNTITLTGLEPNTGYTLYVMAADSVGNITASVEDRAFTTLKHVPEITVNPTISGIYGQKLSEMTVAGGTASYNNNTVTGTWEITEAAADSICPGVSGATEYAVTFKPSDNGKYEEVTVDVIPTVSKKSVIVTAEDKIKTFGEVNPELTFTVPDGTLVGSDSKADLGVTLSCEAGQYSDVKAGGYAITGTSDSANYEVTVTPGTLTIEKAGAEINVQKSSYEVTYGDAPFHLDITDTNRDRNVDVEYEVTAGADSIAVSGDGTVTVKSAKTANAAIKVTLSASTNYNAAPEQTITITINKAQNAPNMPGSTRSVAFSCKTVGAVSLPEGWVWDIYQDGGETTDRTTALEVGIPVKAVAVYNGADEGNYINESIVITITRSVCDHVAGEILYTGTGEHAPDCENTGLGHRECTKCHEVMESGIVVAALGHKGGTAACTKKAVCDVCHQEYGSTNPDNHTTTEVRGYRDADCTLTGYTGDTYCKDCGTRTEVGATVAALGHSYRSEVTKQPTTTSTGVRTYICERCGDSYTETIAKLPEEAHNHSYTGTVTGQADCTNAGVKTYVCSCGDSYTESIPALGHHYTGRVTKEATAAEEGVMTYVCERCGHSYTESIAKLTGDGRQEDTNRPDSDGRQEDANRSDSYGRQEDANRPDGDSRQEDTNRSDGDGKPETGKPYIEGRADRNGWDHIREQLEAAGGKDTVTVDMNGTTVVPGDVFDTVKGKDVTVVFHMGDGITWTVNGKDITADKVEDIDFGVQKGGEAGSTIPVELLNNVTGERYSMNVTLAYGGEFGFRATLSLEVGRENAGLYANLFYYNPETDSLEYVCADKIDAEGNAHLDFTHASDYTIVVDTADMRSADTGSASGTPSVSATAAGNAAWNPRWMIVIGAVILIVGIGAFLLARKKREPEEADN